MSKKGKKNLSLKESKNKKVIIVILLIIIVLIGLYFYNKDTKQLAYNDTYYYTGTIYSANHAANMLDYLDKGNNLVLSPINVNTSLAILYNGTDNNSNKELKNYFKKTTTEVNEEMNSKLETIKETKQETNKYNKLYESFINKLMKNSYNELTTETIALLDQTEQEELLLLLRQIELSYERINNKNKLSESTIKEYVLTTNDLVYNNYTLKEQLDNIISNYELYSINNKVENNTKIIVKDFNKEDVNDEFTTNTSFYNYDVETIEEEISTFSPRVINEPENKSVIINNNLDFTYSWETAFNHNNIKDAEFFNLNNEVKAVEMMYSIESSYLENSKARGFKYDFKDGKYSYVGILPKTNEDFKLSELNLDSLLVSKREDTTLIGVPKMDYTSEINIKELASYYDINEVFTSEANFTKITDENLVIDEMIQKNNLTIAEKGTVKSTLKQTKNHEITQEFKQQIILNRPYAYLIINNETNDIMFIGKVVNITND